MEELHQLIATVDGWLWGPPLLVLLFGTHLFLTWRLKFIQKHIGKAIRLSLHRSEQGEGDISPFGSLSTALAATVGTGNIVGVATAITLGGPGAIFWMWLTGVFGIATKYSEALLSVKYRVQTEDGTMAGGPMYVLERGLNLKWLGILFALFTTIAAFGIGNMVQSNSISRLVENNFGVSPTMTGIGLSILTFLVIIGGIKSIANFCEKLVPFMASVYILGCLSLIIANIDFLLPALKLIFVSAFTPHAAGGGFVGATILMAVQFGIARGLFSNESGLGSAPIVAAAAKTRNPVRQGLISATGTFWDTVVICGLSGLAMVTTIMKYPEATEGLKGADLTHAIFSQLHGYGSMILTVSLFTFVFSTIIGWSYYGERALEYLVGKRGILPYRLLWVGAVMLGSITAMPIVWDFSDMMNALMAIPNLIALILLSGVVVSETKRYLWEDRLDHDSDEPETLPELVPEFVRERS